MPPNSDYKGYHQYIDEILPPESPYLYGLHPNAEIGFLTMESDNLFKVVLELQPRDTGGGEGGGSSREEKVSSQAPSRSHFKNIFKDKSNLIHVISFIQDSGIKQQV